MSPAFTPAKTFRGRSMALPRPGFGEVGLGWLTVFVMVAGLGYCLCGRYELTVRSMGRRERNEVGLAAQE